MKQKPEEKFNKTGETGEYFIGAHSNYTETHK